MGLGVGVGRRVWVRVRGRGLVVALHHVRLQVRRMLQADDMVVSVQDVKSIQVGLVRLSARGRLGSGLGLGPGLGLGLG